MGESGEGKVKMQKYTHGRIVKGVGSFYEVELVNSEQNSPQPNYQRVICRARGVLRLESRPPLVGDFVEIAFEDKEQTKGIINKILQRKNSLIRPPLANIDYIFAVISVRSPDPLLPVADKLISIAEYNKIEPVIIINKTDLDTSTADKIAEIYRFAGFSVFRTSSKSESEISLLSEFIDANLPLKTAAFAGVSGAGKSTILNLIFPALTLPTRSVSEKIGRGRHTTRHVELFRTAMPPAENFGYIADTPGFSMLDFESFDFFSLEDLPFTFREFLPYIGECKYTKCSHTKEDGCAILAALKSGKINESRHQSYLELYEVLKNKNIWKR